MTEQADEAAERVRAYVKTRTGMRGLDPDILHALHFGCSNEATLTLSDLRTLLYLLDKRTEALKEIADKCSCGSYEWGNCVHAIAREALADDATVAPGDATELPPRWLNFGQLHCDRHRQGIPFFIVPSGAKCAECSDNAPESYLRNIDRPTVAAEEE